MDEIFEAIGELLGELISGIIKYAGPIVREILKIGPWCVGMGYIGAWIYRAIT